MLAAKYVVMFGLILFTFKHIVVPVAHGAAKTAKIAYKGTV